MTKDESQTINSNVRSILYQRRVAGQIRLHRWLPRKRISKLLFTSIFALTLTVSVVLGSAFPTYTQTPNPTPREALIEEIKGYAERHVTNDSQMQTKLVVELYENNQVGLTAPEIAKIYEEEYTKLKEAKETDLWEQLPVSWITAAILFILLIFRDALQEWLSNAVKTAGNWLYNRLAGSLSPPLLKIALRRYQQALMEKHQKLDIPFRLNRPLDLREVYVTILQILTSHRRLPGD